METMKITITNDQAEGLLRLLNAEIMSTGSNRLANMWNQIIRKIVTAQGKAAS